MFLAPRKQKSTYFSIAFPGSVVMRCHNDIFLNYFYKTFACSVQFHSSRYRDLCMIILKWQPTNVTECHWGTYRDRYSSKLLEYHLRLQSTHTSWYTTSLSSIGNGTHFFLLIVVGLYRVLLLAWLGMAHMQLPVMLKQGCDIQAHSHTS